MNRFFAYLRRVGARRIAGSFIGNFCIALGVSLFKYSQLGTDPANAMALALADRIGLSFVALTYCINILWFLLEFLWGRSYIGVGTFVNWLLISPVATFFMRLYERFLPASVPFAPRVAVMFVGVVIISFGLSLYQTSDSGLSPYDSLPNIIAKRTRIPFLWCRIAMDGICTLIAWLLGGVVGLGTLICSLGLGPIISFFDRVASRKLLRVAPQDSKK